MLSVLFARQVPVVPLSALHNSLQLNDRAVLQESKNGIGGKQLSIDNKEAAYEAVLSFGLLNNWPADTTVYVRVGTNSSIRLLLYDSMGKPVSQQQTGYNTPVQQQFGRDEEYFLPIQIQQGQTLAVRVFLKGFLEPGQILKFTCTHKPLICNTCGM